MLLTTIRSHDQFNTTIYGFDDRYRGISGERRVVFVNPGPGGARLRAHQRLDVTSHYRGTLRTVSAFRAVPYDIPRGCAACYFPEANPLVPLENHADESHTPASKSIVVTLAAAAREAAE